ncbi:DNA methyltransferase [Campylobacter sp. 46490-21]|uniref:DNA methyltransferase n=1 Tax=Campylobacter magnus TaxID=3026462 RepID=UPI002361C4B8|nr:DNA methyltransferase [Campylobacter magnus]MDD0848758.1 DNA methyltransferase [Campylobacter magnus]
MNQRMILENIYEESFNEYSSGNFNSSLNDDVQNMILVLAKNAESSKAAVTVIITLMVQKIFNPNQDIRYHQAQLENGFSGRRIDTEFITPFLKEVKFPAMAESGWMTHSLAEPYPYDLNYQGKIRPKEQRNAFLNIIDYVQTKNTEPKEVLKFLFKNLIRKRDEIASIELAKPQNFSISKIIDILHRHFTFKYSSQGGARLPVLAIFAAYECMMNEVARFNDKFLCPLEHHGSADLQSGRIGDIDVNYADNTAFEGVEIKHERIITPQLVMDAYEKFKGYKTDRYYLLTTADMSKADWEQIENKIIHISQIHGCEVIVNGVYTTLKYYLRLLSNKADFIDKYVELLKSDDTIKYEHKITWNNIISN